MKSQSFINFKACTTLSMLLISGNALSDVLVDPHNIGSTNVFSDSTQLFIGFNGPGEIEVNTNNFEDGISGIIKNDIQVGASTTLGGGSGILSVIGDGTAGSAFVQANDSFAVGVGGNGQVAISNGGLVSAARVQLGAGSNHDVDIIVDGTNSRLEAVGGNFGIGGSAIGSLVVSNGATIGASGAEFGSTLSTSKGSTISVIGQGSSATFETRIFNFGNLNIQNGGSISQVEVPGLIDGFAEPGDPAFLSLLVGSTNHISIARITGSDVNGNASQLSITRDAQIGGVDLPVGSTVDENGNFQIIFEPSSGTMIVDDGGIFEASGNVLVSENGTGGDGKLTIQNGGQVIASSVTLFEGGILDGNGGSIIGNVIVDGGMVAPGNSPGTLNIDGDLTVLDGVFSLELGFGGMSDIINITGDAIFGPDVIFEILLGDTFIGNQIDLTSIILANSFSIDNAFDPLNNILLLVSGGSALPENTQISVDFGGSSPVILSTSNGSSAVPEPTIVWLLSSGILGFIGMRKSIKVSIKT